VATLQPLQRIFDTVPLDAEQWGLCLLAALVYLVVAEGEKLFQRHRRAGREDEVQREPVPAAAVAEG
jgi:hypothetical protein